MFTPNDKDASYLSTLDTISQYIFGERLKSCIPGAFPVLFRTNQIWKKKNEISFLKDHCAISGYQDGQIDGASFLEKVILSRYQSGVGEYCLRIPKKAKVQLDSGDLLDISNMMKPKERKKNGLKVLNIEEEKHFWKITLENKSKVHFLSEGEEEQQNVKKRRPSGASAERSDADPRPPGVPRPGPPGPGPPGQSSTKTTHRTRWSCQSDTVSTSQWE